MIHPDFLQQMKMLCIAGAFAAFVSLIIQLAPGVLNIIRFGPME